MSWRGTCLAVIATVQLFFSAPRASFWDDVNSLRHRDWACDEEIAETLKMLPTHYAYTDFYVQSGGSNANSGSTTGAVIWSNASTSWVGAGTSTLTVTDAAASAVSLNDYINVGGGWISQVTNVNATGAPTYVFTLGGTVGWGTEPGTNASIAATDGGPWASLAFSVFTVATIVPSSTRVNIKQATYTLAGAINSQLAGSTTVPLWFRGYNTTPGDLDNGSTTLSYPLFTGGANLYTANGAYSIYSGMSFTASRSGNTVSTSGQPIRYFCCQFASTSANSAAAAFGTGGSTQAYHCSFTTPSTANQVVSSATTAYFEYCFFSGAGSGATQVGIVSTGGIYLAYCTFNSTGSYALTQAAASVMQIDFCTFNQCGVGGTVDAIKFLTSIPTIGSRVTNSYFYKSGGYDINYSLGTATGNVRMRRNCSNQPATGHMTGFGDWWEDGATSAGAAALSESLTPPFVSTTDLHLLPSSVGYGAADPGQWEGQTSGLTSNPSVGAWQYAGGTVSVAYTVSGGPGGSPQGMPI
jgi:hypothetical protein